MFDLSHQIRSDTNLCLNSTLPHIYAKSQQMKAIFERIDKLEVRLYLKYCYPRERFVY